MTRAVHRRIVAAVVVAAALALSACSSGSSSSSGSSESGGAVQTLRYGISGNLSIYWHVYVGQHEGIFAKHHLKLDVVTTQTGSASDLLSLLVAGNVDMADVLPDPVLAASANAKVKVLNLTASGVYILVARKGINSFDDLKKLSSVKAAVSSASTATAGLSEQMLENGGIDKSKISLVVSGGTTARLAAVSSGNVDVAVLVQPADFQAQSQGMKVLADSVNSAPWYGLTDTVMANSLSSNCAKYRDFFAAMKDIHTFLTDPANKQKAIQSLVDAKVSSQADAEKTYDLYTKDKAMPGVNTPAMTLTQTNALLASLGTKPASNPTGLVDTSCVS